MLLTFVMIFPELLIIVTVSMGMVDVRCSAEHEVGRRGKSNVQSLPGKVRMAVRQSINQSSRVMRCGMRCDAMRGRGRRSVLKGEVAKGER